MLLVYIFRRLICLSVTEITIQLLGVSDPASTQDFKSVCFIWVILTEVTHISLLLILAPYMARKRVLMLGHRILDGHSAERHRTMHVLLNPLAFLPVIRLLVHKVLERVLAIIEFGKETATVLKFDVTTLFNCTVQVRFNLAATPLANVTREQMAWQVPERMVVTTTERLLDAIRFRVGELIEHGT